MVGLLVIIGISCVLVRLFVVIKLEESGMEVPLALLILLAFLMWVFVPTGWKEWQQIDEVELVSLSNSTVTEGGGFIYVSVSGENVYSYRHEVLSEFSTETSKEYKVDTVSENEVIESEDSQCQKPVLKVYRRKSKATIWTLGLFQKDTKYVFYVPEGSIQKEINLK